MKQLLSSTDVQQATSLSRTTLWRLERAGIFPKGIFISPRRKAWRRDDVESWIMGCANPLAYKGDRAQQLVASNPHRNISLKNPEDL